MKQTATYIRKKLGKRPRTSASSSSAQSQSSHHSHHSPHSNPSPAQSEEADVDQDMPLAHQPMGETFGIIFTRQTAVDIFLQSRGRKILNTKFYHKRDMTALGIHEGITTLFKNIGWEGFLQWDEVGYRRPTLEFISSCVLNNVVLFFRMYNHQYSISTDDVCALAGPPTENTFPVFSRLAPAFDMALFWKEITGLDTFEPRHLKTSFIIHPTLRVAARILTVSIFAREEAGTLNMTELVVLWCMVHKPVQKPNLGSYLLSILEKCCVSPKSPIHLSGLITKLIKSPVLGIHIPDDEIQIDTDRYIGKANLIRGNLLREDPLSKTFTWLLGSGKVPHLVLKRKDFGLLKLRRPVNNTNWCLPSNISTHEASGSGRHQGDDGAGSSNPVPEPARHSEASYFSGLQSHYESLHSDYQGLNDRYTSLHDNYTALQGSYSSMTSDVSTIRSDLTTLRNSFELERADNVTSRTAMRNFMTEFQSQQNDIHRMVTSFFDWHVHEHPPPPPPEE